MIRSMTGYGKATNRYQHRQVTVEIKTLNAKQLDIGLKLPSEYSEYEPEIRNLLATQLERGKVFCQVTVECTGDAQVPQVNEALAKAWYQQFQNLELILGLKPSHEYLSLILRMPEVMKTPAAVTGPEEYQILMQTVSGAAGAVNLFRDQEGNETGRDILARIANIDVLLKKIKPFEQGRIDRLKERIIRDLSEGVNLEYDRNRLEQELIYYLEKFDINEEKVRLGNHLTYFRQVMKEGDSNGRKLAFIAQEIGREVNTLGSKANDADIQRLVVEIKDELEKVKEQLLNIL